MLSVKENERLTRVGPGTPMGALLREQMAITEAGKDPMNVFRDPAQNTILHIPTEHGLVETARARRLSTGQAPYSQLMDQIETQWAKAPSAAD